jgi:hypothetical protein
MSLEVKDLVVLGLSRMPSQWLDKPFVQGLVKSLVGLMQPLEEAFHELNNERGIYTAVGIQLDVLGLILGVSRQGRSDEAYRSALLLQSAINSSDATMDGLIGILQILTQDTTAGMVEHYPATALARANSGANPLVPVTMDLVAAAGVSIDGSHDYIVGDHFMFPLDTGSQIINPIAILGNSADNNYLSHSADIDLGYTINPCSHGVKPTDPTVTIAIIQLDNGDTLITDNGDNVAVSSS